LTSEVSWAPERCARRASGSCKVTPMCTIGLLLHAHPTWPLVIAANRDELYARPATGLEVVSEAPRALAGRDLDRGGSWLGVNATGFVAGLTNLRPTRRAPAAPRSRGVVVLAVLRLGDVQAACDLLASLAPADFSGGQLVFGTADDLRIAYFRPEEAAVKVERVPNGVHVLATSTLNDPAYPKAHRLRQALEALPADWPGVRRKLAAALARHETAPRGAFPTDHGLFDRDTLQALDAVCIHTPSYGTRAATLIAARVGRVDHLEATTDAPCRADFVDYGPNLRGA